MNRDKLIEELLKLNLGVTDRPYQEMADWIIADRRRICGPIISYKNMVGESGDKWPQGMEDIAIDETLALADLGDK